MEKSNTEFGRLLTILEKEVPIRFVDAPEDRSDWGASTTVKGKDVWIEIYNDDELTEFENICFLLHEWGHVKDYRKNKNKKRWSLVLSYPYRLPQLRTYPKYVKLAHLASEKIAEDNVLTDLKKYDIQVEYPLWVVSSQAYLRLLSLKYEMMHGYPPDTEVAYLWEEKVRVGQLQMPKDFHRNLEIDLG